MFAQTKTSVRGPLEALEAVGFEISPSTEAGGWMLAVRGGCAVVFRETGDRRIEMFHLPGLYRQGRIFRVLDKGFQKFLSDDRREIPATAPALEQINDFYQDFKDALGLPVLFNESLGALTAVTRLDGVERPILRK